MLQQSLSHINRTIVTSIHYQTLPKQDTTWKIDVNNLPVLLLQGLLLLFLDKRDDFANKNQKFYNSSIKTFQPETFTMLKRYFSIGHGKTFYRQNLGYGQMHFQILTKIFTTVTENQKRVTFYSKQKKQPKVLMVILHAMCLVLQRQQLMWQPGTPVEFNHRKVTFQPPLLTHRSISCRLHILLLVPLHIFH